MLHLETVHLQLGGFTFYLPGLSPRRVLTVENENGRLHGKSMHNARLACVGICSYWIEFRLPPVWVSREYFFTDTPMKIMKCVGSDVGLVWDA